MDLRSYGEDELAARASRLTEDELTRLGTRAGELILFGRESLLAKAVALAAVEVMEGATRELRFKRRKVTGIYPDG